MYLLRHLTQNGDVRLYAAEEVQVASLFWCKYSAKV